MANQSSVVVTGGNLAPSIIPADSSVDRAIQLACSTIKCSADVTKVCAYDGNPSSFAIKWSVSTKYPDPVAFTHAMLCTLSDQGIAPRDVQVSFDGSDGGLNYIDLWYWVHDASDDVIATASASDRVFGTYKLS